ncbi:tRNA (guanosine(46)-N7)-methyltransferase TrmB [Mycobacterium sp. NPDC049093]
MRDDGRMHPSRSDVGGPASADEAADVPPAQPHRFPRVTSFRTRRSTLSPAQQQTWDRLWPEVGIQARDEDSQPVVDLDTTAWFGRSAPLILEIGSGTGTSTLAMAQAEPDFDVVAVEVYRKGLAQLLSAIDRTNQTSSPVTNIRLVRGDGVDVLEHMFTTGTLTAVRVYFPDPWPKARHHKRRLLQPATVALIADRLLPGGILHAATDHAGYAEHIAEVGDAEPRLRRVEPGAALPVSVERPVTKYERKALAGPDVTELVWEKLP